MQTPWLRALQGAVLAAGAPLGWMAVQWLGGADVAGDVRENMGVYLYMWIGTTAVFGAFGAYVGVHEQNYELRALHDPLTDLFNLRYFRRQLARQIADATRRGEPLSLIILDLDHFKQVNDRYGHATGDEVLTAVAHAVEKQLRGGDAAARIGGEEFAALLPATDGVEARAVAERMRSAVSDIEFVVPRGQSFRITASFGVAVRAPGVGESPMELMQRADRAMYAAKERGRNQTVLAD